MSNDLFYEKINNLVNDTKEGIRLAAEKIGEKMKEDAQNYILNPPKTGNIYRVRLGYNYITHQASAPGESPANLTGTLKDSIEYEVTESSLTLGSDVRYADYLETGTWKMKSRPYLTRAIMENKSAAHEYMITYLKQELTNGA